MTIYRIKWRLLTSSGVPLTLVCVPTKILKQKSRIAYIIDCKHKAMILMNPNLSPHATH